LKLEYIVLKNYRKFTALELYFPAGAIAVMGGNGSGKSTLLEAVAWTLYGNETPIVRVNKESIKNVRALGKDPVIAELGFILEGQKYVVTREMRGTTLTSRANVTCQGALAVEGPTDVNAYLKDLLGLDYQGFFSSVYAKQKELKALSNEDPAERRRLIIRMLGIDAIEKALVDIRHELRGGAALLKERRKMLKDDEGHSLIKGKRSELELNSEKKEQQIMLLARRNDELKIGEEELVSTRHAYEISQEMRDEHRSLRAKSEETKKMIALHNNSVKKLTAELKELIKARDELDAISQELLVLPLLEEELRSQERAKAAEKKRIDILSKIEETEKDRERNTRELKGLSIDRERKKYLKKTLEDLDRSFEKELEERENLKRETAIANQAIERLEGKVQRYRDRLGELSRLPETSLCPTCERPLGEAHPKLIEKYSLGIEKRKKEKETQLKRRIDFEISRKGKDEVLEELRKKQKDARAEMDTFHSKKERQVVLLERLKTINNNMDQYKREMEELDTGVYDHLRYEELLREVEKLEEKRKRSMHLEERVSRIAKIENERDQKKRDKKEMEKLLTDISRRYLKIDFDEKEHHLLRKKIDELTSRLSDLKGYAGKVGEVIKFLAREQERLAGEVKRLEKFEDDVRILEEETLYLSRLDNLMNGFWSSLITRIRPILSTIASGFISQLTDGRYSQIEIGENYEILIYDGPNKYPISRFSGGEEDLANLCLRLAISSIIAATKKKQGLQFIVLDEIFGSQDNMRRRNILEAMAQLLKRFRQVFIITHIEQVREHIGNVILVEEGPDGNSTAKMLED